MRDFDEFSITEAVLTQVRNSPNLRVRKVSEALVRHLHAFVREVQPTFEEWEIGIEFLTRTGRMCDGNRQEFILLPDAVGVSMLVDVLNHREVDRATESTVLGPFFLDHAPELALGSDISAGATGEPLLVTGTVSSTDGHRLAGATIDAWHSDGEGYYDVQRLDETGGPSMRARFRTDGSGRFHFLVDQARSLSDTARWSCRRDA